MIYNVHEFGAVGDGIHNDAPAIQAAIDACSSNGGGRVVLSSNHIYKAGAIVLRSYVELHLEMGAVLKASDCLEDFNLFGAQSSAPEGISVPTYENCDYTGSPTLYFLYAKDCEYVAITGFGKIDGSHEQFFGTVTKWHIDGSFYPRVPLLFLEHVSHLTLQQVTLTNSGFWTTHLIGCEDVLIDGLRILNDLRLANCDGIDPDHCKNVRISNCHIESADDCIVFKNTAHNMKYGPCENIVVSNCTLISTSAAIKFGSESEAPFRNITVSNCTISRTNRGISLMLRDGGSIENVIFSNIHIETRMFSKMHWWGEAEPIAITAVRRNPKTKVGHIKNLTFSNIYCRGENGILIYGEDSMNISDIYFDHVNVSIEKKTDWPKNFHDLRPCEERGIFEGNLCTIYARNASNIHFRGFCSEVSEEMRQYMAEGKEFDIDQCDSFVLHE